MNIDGTRNAVALAKAMWSTSAASAWLTNAPRLYFQTGACGADCDEHQLSHVPDSSATRGGKPGDKSSNSKLSAEAVALQQVMRGIHF